MIYKTVLNVIIVITSITSLAQPPAASENTPLKRVIVTGRIVDSQTSQNMEYANVSIFNIQDSILISGSISDAEGLFTIKGIEPGSYYLEAKFIGFEKTRVNNLNISGSKKEVNLGTLKLSPNTKEIGAVEVIADRNRVEYKIDKKIVNVGQDINSAGGTAVDVLENTPSVQVDIEGNVTLRGSSNFTVLIDGRPSMLSGSDALQQVPASALENIEIITNPSVKYDPDGMAGIINLVMKKDVQSGFNGVLNTSIGTKDKQRADILINHKTAKRTITFGADLNNYHSSGSTYSLRETFLNDTTFYINKDGKRKRNRSGYGLKGGVDFYISKNSTLGFFSRYVDYTSEGGGESQIMRYSNPAVANVYTLELDPSSYNGSFIENDIHFQSKFNEEGTHKLDMSVNFAFGKGTNLDEEGELYTDSNFNPTNGYYSRVQTREAEDETDIRIKADYTKPIGKSGKLEAGYQTRIDKERDDYLFENFDTENQDWIYNDKYSSILDYYRGIHSVYSTVASQLGSLEYMMGLRGEYTDRELNHHKSDQVYKLNRLDFFPSLHLSYNLLGESQLMASYSRRIDRPRGRDLEPLESYRDQYTIRVGNPDLKPEYTNSYELGFMKRFGNSFISLESFYRVTDNKITRLSEVKDDNITYETRVNMNKDYSLGGELMLNLNLTEWFLFNASTSIYNYKLEDETDGIIVEKESTNIDGRINTTFKFSTESRLQLSGMYRGPSISLQGERTGVFYTNISYRQSFFKRKLTATLSLRDVLGTGKYEGTNSGSNFKYDFKYQREPRILTLTLSYKINNYKSERSSSGSNDMDFSDEDF